MVSGGDSVRRTGRTLGDATRQDRTQQSTGRRDRAQLIMIAAVIIAVFVLGAVVLLNLLHESAEFKSEQDRVSIDTSERVSHQVYHNLHRYFLAHSASDELHPGVEPDDPWEFQLPFADGQADFRDDVAALSAPYTRLSADTRASITEVTYLPAESEQGVIVWKNTTSDGTGIENASNPTNANQYIDGATALPRLFVDVDFGVSQTHQLRIYLDDTRYLTLHHDEVEVHEGVGGCQGLDSSYELDLVHGSGEVRSGDTYCSIALDMPDGSFDVRVEGAAVRHSSWKYFISGTDGSINGTYYDEDMFVDEDNQYHNPIVWGKENVVVDPTFAVVYQDANTRYRSTIRLFGEDRR